MKNFLKKYFFYFNLISSLLNIRKNVKNPNKI